MKNRASGPITRCFLETDKSRLDYSVLTKTGLSVDFVEPCKLDLHVAKKRKYMKSQHMKA